MIDYTKLNYDDQDATLDLMLEASFTDYPEATVEVPTSYLLRILDRLKSLNQLSAERLAKADIPETKLYILDCYDKLHGDGKAVDMSKEEFDHYDKLA